MAEKSSAAISSAGEGITPTSSASTPAPGNTNDGASFGLSAEALADLGLIGPEEVKASGAEANPKPKAKVDPPDESGEEQKPEPTPEELEKAAIAKAEADALKDEKGDDDEDATEDELKKVPEWVPERLKKLSDQKKALREERDALKAAKEEADKALAEAAANIKAPLPPSPLAWFTTEESLEKENDAVLAFMERSEKPDFAESYKDFDAESGQSAQFENDKAYARHFLKHQKAHAQVLKTRHETTEAVKKAAPALFDGKSEQAKERAALYQSDPRTRPDFDQLIADALRGRQVREEEAKGNKYHLIDLAKLRSAKPANGNGKEHANGKAKASEKFTPASSGSTRAPAKPTNGSRGDLLDTAMRTQKPVSVDDLMDSWAN